MYSYSYIPPKDAKKATIIVTACFALGLGLVFFSGLVPYKFVMQIIGIMVLSVGLFTATRYIIRSYAYSITGKSAGDYDLVINQVQGGKSIVVCRVGMDDICDFYCEADGKKIEKNIARYDYCQNIGEKNAYFIIAELQEGKFAIRFAPDEKMVDIIESLRKKNNEF